MSLTYVVCSLLQSPLNFYLRWGFRFAVGIDCKGDEERDGDKHGESLKGYT